MLIKGQDVDNIVAGNTLSDVGLPHKHFDNMLCNPPKECIDRILTMIGGFSA